MINSEAGAPVEISNGKTEDVNEKQIQIPENINLTSAEIKELEEEIQEMLDLEYISFDEYPELSETVDIIRDEINSIRKKLNLPNIDFQDSDFRLIPEEEYDKLKYVKKAKELRKIDLGGFYNSLIKKSFIKFNPEKYKTSRSEQLGIKDFMIHEGMHAGMDGDGIAKYSRYLNEAVVSRKSREIMEQRIILNMFKVKDYENRKEYSDMAFANEMALYPRDIVIWDEKTSDPPVVNGYTTEVHLLEEIKNKKPDLYKGLLESCFRGDPENARNLIENTYGKEVTNLLSNEIKGEISFEALLEKMEKADKNAQ